MTNSSVALTVEGENPMANATVDLTIKMQKQPDLPDISYTIQFDDYRLYVSQGTTITWTFKIELGSGVNPSGGLWAAIYGFIPAKPGTPVSPFDGFKSYGTELRFIQGSQSLEGTFTSDPVHVAPPEKGAYQWEYTIYILGDEGVVGRIDPMLVLSGNA